MSRMASALVSKGMGSLMVLKVLLLGGDEETPVDMLLIGPGIRSFNDDCALNE